MHPPVLLTTDFSPAARRAYLPAARLALRTHATVRLLHVVEHLLPTWLTASPESHRGVAETTAAQHHLDAEAARIREHGQPVETALRSGDAATEISKEASRCSAVVMATQGYGGVKGFLLGSTAARILRTCPTTLLTVTPGARDQVVRTVVAPVDVHEPPCGAFIEELQRLGRNVERIELYHAIWQPSYAASDPAWAGAWDARMDGEAVRLAKHRLDEYALKTWTGPAIVTVHIQVARRPAVAIADRAKTIGADVVVMSAHGTHGMARWFVGSVTEETIRRAPCPVLAVRRRPC